MADQRKALADTTELTDTVYFVHPTGIRTLRTMVREVTRGLETGEYQGLHNENLPGGWRKVSMDESEHREVTRRLAPGLNNENLPEGWKDGDLDDNDSGAAT